MIVNLVNKFDRMDGKRYSLDSGLRNLGQFVVNNYRFTIIYFILFELVFVIVRR